VTAAGFSDEPHAGAGHPVDGAFHGASAPEERAPSGALVI
jgi:hypothetical protein